MQLLIYLLLLFFKVCNKAINGFYSPIRKINGVLFSLLSGCHVYCWELIDLVAQAKLSFQDERGWIGFWE